MKRIALSLAVVAVVGSVAIGATRAYFSDTETVYDNTFATGSVEIGDIWSLPLSFTNLIPTIEQKQDASVQYIGTTPADIYIGMSNQSGDAFYNPSTDKSYLEVAIYDKDLGIWVQSWSPVKKVLSGWVKVATDVSPNAWRNYEVHIRLIADADDTFQNKSNKSKLHIYAIQTGINQLPAAPWTF